MDNYRSRIIALHEAQTRKGMDKYGTVLEQNTDDIFKRLEHFRQEMLDGLNYSFWLEDELRKLVIGKSCNSCINRFEISGKCIYYPEKQKICIESDYCFWDQSKSLLKDCQNCTNSTPKGCDFGLGWYTKDYCIEHDYCHHSANEKHEGCEGCANQRANHPNGCQFHPQVSSYCRKYGFCHYVSEDAVLEISGPEVTC